MQYLFVGNRYHWFWFYHSANWFGIGVNMPVLLEAVMIILIVHGFFLFSYTKI